VVFLITKWKRGVLVRIGGSLSNYKTVLHYSLSSPGRSNLETHRLVYQEFVSSHPPKSIGREDVNENRTSIIHAGFTKTDYMIKMMAEDLALVRPFSKEIQENWTSKDPSLFDRLVMNDVNSGKYIDLYI
jgi:hypothetical protein